MSSRKVIGRGGRNRSNLCHAQVAPNFCPEQGPATRIYFFVLYSIANMAAIPKPIGSPRDWHPEPSTESERENGADAHLLTVQEIAGLLKVNDGDVLCCEVDGTSSSESRQQSHPPNHPRLFRAISPGNRCQSKFHWTQRQEEIKLANVAAYRCTRSSCPEVA
jgi:hypothetical protein